jgi:Protein of unknown function (DUF1524)
VDDRRFCRQDRLGFPEERFIRPSWELRISYRLELGALLLAIAASSVIGLLQRRRAGAKRRTPRAAVILTVAAGVAGVSLLGGCGTGSPADVPTLIQSAQPGSAMAALGALAVKGRAPKTGYARTQFGAAWADVDRNGCDTRDDILRRDLTGLRYRASTGGCVVLAGTLADPYTGSTIDFAKANASAVQIDHIVALSDAWQTGAQQLTAVTRRELANDPLNLFAVDGPSNQDKGDSDAASWLPPRKAFRCTYVSRQVAVKTRYHLWVTPAERDAIARVLRSCPDQALPN